MLVANLDFEHQLGRHQKANLAAHIQRLNDELAAAMVAIADDGDYLWLPAAVSPDFFAALADQGLPAVRPVTNAGDVEGPVDLCPWGWTPSLRKWGEQHRWNVNAPPQQAVAAANARSFSARLEQAWNIGLSRTVVAESLTSFFDALDAMPDEDARWVVKAEFGMSARERILGMGREPSFAATQWADKRLKTDGVVVVEPWVDKIAEAGLQFIITKEGDVAFLGLCWLLTDATGQYRGSRLTHLDEELSPEWASAVQTGLLAAGELADLGYFGPLGIDAVLYRDDDGNTRLRPLQDINARHTMGRLALGFGCLLASDEHGSWLHTRWPTDSAQAAANWLERVRSQLPAGARLIPTSPFEVGGRPTAHGTLVVTAPSLSALQVAEAAVFAAQ